MDDGLGGDSWLDQHFMTVWWVLAGVIAVIAVLTVVTIVRNGRALRRRGYDPTTLGATMTTRLLESEALSPRRSTTERLAEIDRLQSEGTISAAEREAARARVLGET